MLTNDKNSSEKYLDLLASKIAEVMLSGFGYRLIPGLYPVFRRFKKYLEARAYIVKREGGNIC